MSREDPREESREESAKQSRKEPNILGCREAHLLRWLGVEVPGRGLDSLDLGMLSLTTCPPGSQSDINITYLFCITTAGRELTKWFCWCSTLGFGVLQHKHLSVSMPSKGKRCFIRRFALITAFEALDARTYDEKNPQIRVSSQIPRKYSVDI